MCPVCNKPAKKTRRNKRYIHPSCRFKARCARACARALAERNGNNGG